LLKLVGAAVIALVDFVTPLFQTNFLPDLMHVYVLLETTVVRPAFEHTPPALAAAVAGNWESENKTEKRVRKITGLFFIQ
jgi:hypothetical protein